MVLPIKWSELAPDHKKDIQDNHEEMSCMYDLVQFENGLVMPRLFAEEVSDKVYDFKLRDDDIWIVSFPKSGTSWTIENVWSLLNIEDLKKGKDLSLTVPQVVRCPLIESYCCMNKKILEAAKAPSHDDETSETLEDPVETLNKMEGRRLIKSHLPLNFLPPDLLDKNKVIYVARNPRDAAVSWHFFDKIVPMSLFTGSFKKWMDWMISGKYVYSDWFQHFNSFWKQKEHPNLKIVWYEEKKENARGILKDISAFLEHPLSEEDIEMIERKNSFENMKKNPNANPLSGIKGDGKGFQRKGIVGDWKNHFDEEMESMWDKYIEDNVSAFGLEEIKFLEKH